MISNYVYFYIYYNLYKINTALSKINIKTYFICQIIHYILGIQIQNKRIYLFKLNLYLQIRITTIIQPIKVSVKLHRVVFYLVFCHCLYSRFSFCTSLIHWTLDSRGCETFDRVLLSLHPNP